MDDDRRRRFVAWFAETYGPDTAEARAKFMADSTAHGRVLPLTKGRVSQLFDPDEPFGERAARNLADRFGKAETFFLADPSPTAAPAIIDQDGSETDWAIFDAVREMSEDDRTELLKLALERAERHKKVTQEVLRKFAGKDVQARAFEPAKPVPVKAGVRYIRKRPVPKKTIVAKKARKA